MWKNKYIYNIISLILLFLIFNTKLCFSQFIYNSSYDCFVLFSANNYNFCNIKLHEYRFGKVKAESHNYADLRFVNGKLEEYKKYFIDLGYENSRQFRDVFIKFTYYNNKISLIKFYNSDGNLIGKYNLFFENNNNGNFKENIDTTGFTVFSFFQLEETGYNEIKQKKKDTLNTSYLYYNIENHRDQGDIESYEQFIYSSDLNILLYKKLGELYSSEGSKREFYVIDKLKLQYTFDEYGNPLEIIVLGRSNEPEFLLEFLYYN